MASHLIPIVITIVTFVLQAVLPGRLVPGYVMSDVPPYGRLQYKLNGLTTLAIVVAAALCTLYFNRHAASSLVDDASSAVAASFGLGIALSVAFYIRGLRLRAAGAIDERSRCATVDANAPPPLDDYTEFRSRSAVQHFYCGLSEFNPRPLLGVDVKMWLYVVGAVQLQVNTLVGTWFVVWMGPVGCPRAALTVAACTTFFVVEYLLNEDVHLYTYDIFRERLGFKLIWVRWWSGVWGGGGDSARRWYASVCSAGYLPAVHECGTSD